MGKDRAGLLVGITIRLFLLRPEQPYSLPVHDSFDTRLAVHHAISGGENLVPGVMIAAILGWLVHAIVEDVDCSFSPASVQLAKACLNIMHVPTLHCAPKFLYAYCQGRSMGEGHDETLQKTLGYGPYTALVLDDLLVPLKRTSMIIASIHLYNNRIIFEIFRGAGNILAGIRKRWSSINDPSTAWHEELLALAYGRCDEIQSVTQPLPYLQQKLGMLIHLIEDTIRTLHAYAGSSIPFLLVGQENSATDFFRYTTQICVNVSQLQLCGWLPNYAITNKSCEGDRLSLADCPDGARESPLDVDTMAGEHSGISSFCISLPQSVNGVLFDGTYPALIYTCLLHAPGGKLRFHELYTWFKNHTSKSTSSNLKDSIRKALADDHVSIRT